MIKSRYKFILVVICSFLLLNSCKLNKNTIQSIVINEEKGNSNREISLEFVKGKGFNHPTFVIWIEDECGKYLKTIYITKAYATGNFGKQMVGDTVWLNTPGDSKQPAALPVWNFLKGNDRIPDSKNPYVDAYTGATPHDDFKLSTSYLPANMTYRIFVEINQPWDWNKYWTNGKYPDNYAYKHSAQPSVVYSALIDGSQKEYYLNPVGHGDPKGDSGKLYTDLTTLTTALHIFNKIIVKTTK